MKQVKVESVNLYTPSFGEDVKLLQSQRYTVKVDGIGEVQSGIQLSDGVIRQILTEIQLDIQTKLGIKTKTVAKEVQNEQTKS